MDRDNKRIWGKGEKKEPANPTKVGGKGEKKTKTKLAKSTKVGVKRDKEKFMRVLVIPENHAWMPSNPIMIKSKIIQQTGEIKWLPHSSTPIFDVVGLGAILTDYLREETAKKPSEQTLDIKDISIADADSFARGLNTSHLHKPKTRIDGIKILLWLMTKFEHDYLRRPRDEDMNDQSDYVIHAVIRPLQTQDDKDLLSQIVKMFEQGNATAEKIAELDNDNILGKIAVWPYLFNLMFVNRTYWNHRTWVYSWNNEAKQDRYHDINIWATGNEQLFDDESFEAFMERHPAIRAYKLGQAGYPNMTAIRNRPVNPDTTKKELLLRAKKDIGERSTAQLSYDTQKVVASFLARYENNHLMKRMIACRYCNG